VYQHLSADASNELYECVENTDRRIHINFFELDSAGDEIFKASETMELCQKGWMRIVRTDASGRKVQARMVQETSCKGDSASTKSDVPELHSIAHMQHIAERRQSERYERDLAFGTFSAEWSTIVEEPVCHDKLGNLKIGVLPTLESAASTSVPSMSASSSSPSPLSSSGSTTSDEFNFEEELPVCMPSLSTADQTQSGFAMQASTNAGRTRSLPLFAELHEEAVALGFHERGEEPVKKTMTPTFVVRRPQRSSAASKAFRTLCNKQVKM